ncbi:MAG: hypothetical protein QXN03_01155 [Desulfurococcaceae archaeon]
MSEITTIRVSRETFRTFESLRRKLYALTLDEAIHLLIMQWRKQRLEEA